MLIERFSLAEIAMKTNPAHQLGRVHRFFHCDLASEGFQWSDEPLRLRVDAPLFDDTFSQLSIPRAP